MMAGIAAALAAAGGWAGAAPRLGAVQPGIISTVAGGVGGPALATTVALGSPCGLSVGGGKLYVGGQGAVREVSERTGELTAPAGDFNYGPYWTHSGEGGPAVDAPLGACGISHDAAGNLVVTDISQQRVWVVAARTGMFYGQQMTAGHIYDVAGDGELGHSASGALARKAFLYNPGDIVPDKAGNLVLDDRGADGVFPGFVEVVAVRAGTFYGEPMRAGHIYTVAGGSLAISGDGGLASKAGLGGSVGQVQPDHAGNLVIADTPANTIRVVAERTGTIYGQAMTAGHIYAVAGDGQAGFSGDGGPATSAELNDPSGVAVDRAGNLVLADLGNNRIRVVAVRTGTFYRHNMTAGHIYTVAGGTTQSRLSRPDAVAIDGTGSVLTDEVGGLVKMLAEKTGTFYGLKMTAGGLYTVAGNGQLSFSGDGGPATRAELYSPQDLATDGAGDVLIDDTLNERVRVVAAHTGTLFGVAMNKGDIGTVAGNGRRGYSGDGGPATAARLDLARGLAVDHTGNIVLTSGNRIRVVATSTGTFYGQQMTTGDIYTVAGNGTLGSSGDGGPARKAELYLPFHVMVDRYGNLLMDGDETVRMVAVRPGTYYGVAMKAGDIYTIAGQTGVGGFSGDGGPALKATFFAPEGLAVDAAGNLLIADSGSYRIRVVAAATGTFYGQAMKAGDIYTIAGNGSRAYSGNGSPALKAGIRPIYLTVDANGNIVMSDQYTRIRVLAATPGTFYGIAMTAGDVYTITGTGSIGYTGDGGPAIDAQTYSAGITPDPAGNLLLSDYSGRIRQISN
jgi:trimeric autotransporter adhesin